VRERRKNKFGQRRAGRIDVEGAAGWGPIAFSSEAGIDPVRLKKARQDQNPEFLVLIQSEPTL
jgi:hypothetical protein